MGDKVNVDDKIKKLINKNKWNKFFALLGLLLALLLSCALIYHGMRIYDSKKPAFNNITITKYVPVDQICTKQHSVSTTTCCKISPIAERVPAVVTEEVYNNTVNVLLCVSALMFIIFALWGAFTFLFKVLKSEHEIELKVLDVELEIYKEKEMWELTKNKKELDLKLEKDTGLGLKYRELQIRKLEEECKKFDEKCVAQNDVKNNTIESN